MQINNLAKEVYDLAKDKGWWDGEERSLLEIAALIHSEISEAVEEWRNGHDNVYWVKDSNGVEKPEGWAVELADAVIRILDYCHHKHINIEHVIQMKHEYNKTRSYRHGNKRA